MGRCSRHPQSSLSQTDALCLLSGSGGTYLPSLAPLLDSSVRPQECFFVWRSLTEERPPVRSVQADPKLCGRALVPPGASWSPGLSPDCLSPTGRETACSPQPAAVEGRSHGLLNSPRSHFNVSADLCGGRRRVRSRKQFSSGGKEMQETIREAGVPPQRPDRYRRHSPAVQPCPLAATTVKKKRSEVDPIAFSRENEGKCKTAQPNLTGDLRVAFSAVPLL